MKDITIVGIDPGLVHTGLVMIRLGDRLVTHGHKVFSGVDADQIAEVARNCDPTSIYIEDYDMRNNFNTDKRMAGAVERLKNAMPEAKLVNNAGVATLVPPSVMTLFGVWRFSTPTNHQDLRSAARIALLGMLKNKAGQREAMSQVVAAHLNGNTWDVKEVEL